MPDTPTPVVVCAACQQRFEVDLARVPLIPIDGVGHPVCRTCLQRINDERARIGLDPIIGTYPD